MRRIARAVLRNGVCGHELGVRTAGNRVIWTSVVSEISLVIASQALDRGLCVLPDETTNDRETVVLSHVRIRVSKCPRSVSCTAASSSDLVNHLCTNQVD